MKELDIFGGRRRYHHAVRISPAVEIYGGLHEQQSGADAVKQKLVANATMMTTIQKNPSVRAAQAEKDNTVIYLEIGDTYYVNRTIYTHGVDDGTHGSI